METEIKLALDPAGVAALRRHPVLAGHAPTRDKLYSLYFDTPVFDLYKSRVALRLRRVGYRWIQTVKAEAVSTGTLSTRPEWEVQVTGNRPDPVALPEAARSLFREEWLTGLTPAFATRFQRTAWHLDLPGGQVEVALDQGGIEAGEMVQPISEVELELKSGDPAVLFDLVESLAGQLPLSLETRSKAQRGYLLCGAVQARPVKAGRVEMVADQPAGQAWQAMIRAGLAQFAGNVAGCLAENDPEYLHQLRVAVRRLRSTVSLALRLGVPAPAWTGELKWLMGELGPARDWDVFDTETLPRLAGSLASRPGWASLASASAHQRQAANLRARQALSSSRTLGLVLAVERDLLSPHLEALPASDWAARVLERRLRQLKRQGEGFDHLDDLARHQVRIAAKRLRYAGDAFASLYGDRAGTYLDRLGRLQDDLGAANDAAIAARLLADLRRDNRRLVWLTGVAEGYLVAEALARQADLTRAWQGLLTAKRFWKRPLKG